MSEAARYKVLKIIVLILIFGCERKEKVSPGGGLGLLIKFSQFSLALFTQVEMCVCVPCLKANK